MTDKSLLEDVKHESENECQLSGSYILSFIFFFRIDVVEVYFALFLS